jgi:hypothetical protein
VSWPSLFSVLPSTGFGYHLEKSRASEIIQSGSRESTTERIRRWALQDANRTHRRKTQAHQEEVAFYQARLGDGAPLIGETLRNHLRLSETCGTGPGRLSSLFSWDREWRAGQPLQNNLLHNIHLVDS